jgi:tetratricopeptide (TPR) repeat protein
MGGASNLPCFLMPLCRENWVSRCEFRATLYYVSLHWADGPTAPPDPRSACRLNLTRLGDQRQQLVHTARPACRSSFLEIRSHNMRYLLLSSLFGLLLLGVACTPGKSKSEQASEVLERGLRAYAEGRIEEAAAAYQEVLDLEPRNRFAFYNLGLIDQTSGRPRSAENYYRLTLSVDPDFTPALFNLAILRTAAGDAREAIDLYRRVIALKPDEAGPHLNLGLLLRSNGQRAEGDTELKRAVDLDPRLAARIPMDPGQPPSR